MKDKGDWEQMDTNNENQPQKSQEELDREEAARDKRNRTISIIGRTVSKIIAAVSMVAAAYFVNVSWVGAALFAMFAYIFVCVDYFFPYFLVCFRIKAVARYLSEFLISVAPTLLAIIVPLICSTFLDATIVGYIGGALAMLLVMMIVFNFFYFVKKGDLIVGMNVLDYNNHPKHRKIIFHIVLWGGRAFTLLGCVSTFLMGEGGVFFLLVGVIVWAVTKFYERYILALPYNDAAGNGGSTVSSNANSNKKSIGDYDVREIVRKIADRWNNKTDVSFGLESGHVRYIVSYQINGSSITYTVEGKLEGVRPEKIESARTLLTAPMKRVANNITEETQNELSKYRLPLSSYYIQVNTRL